MLNILKALNELSAKPERSETASDEKDAPPPAQQPKPQIRRDDNQNVMIGVLDRHERISNRVRSNGKRGVNPDPHR